MANVTQLDSMFMYFACVLDREAAAAPPRTAARANNSETRKEAEMSDYLK